MERKELLKHLPTLLIGTIALLACSVLNPVNHYACALMLLVCAVALYFYTAVIPAGRNWWDIRALFSAIWLATIGLASLRLTEYQRPWETATWLILGSCYAMFYIGSTLGIHLGQKCFNRCKDKGGFSLKKISFRLHGERLFWICFGVTLFCIACFAANVAIRGFIPYFARTGNAYVDFYTKFHIFTTAGTGISGLCYYTLKTQKLSLWKKIFLWFSLVYSTFLFPMLVVSRGMFLTAALSLTTVIFYMNKRRFLLLVLSIAVIGAFYMEGTKARGYSEDQLNEFFEPSVIAPENGNADDPSADSGENGDTAVNNPGFQLSGSAAFVYSYLTVSHDNFNEAVRTVDTYTYGLRQLLPFNVIMRIGAIDARVEEVGHNFVREHLNTTNLVGEAYYDFGAIGPILLMLLWAIAFGMIQSIALSSDGPFGLMTLGNTITPVALCFFESWMSIFSHWMHWGFVLILFLMATITKKTQDTNAANP